MNNKDSWITEKKRLRTKSLDEIKQALKQFKEEMFHAEKAIRAGAQRNAYSKDTPVNLKSLRHRIAFLNGVINERGINE